MRFAILTALAVMAAACANANTDTGRLAVDPPAVMIVAGTSAKVQATSTESSLSTLSWFSEDLGTATVEAFADGSATITGVAPGHTSVEAGLGVIRRTVDVEVVAAVLDRLDIAAPHTMLPRGRTTQLVAMGHFTDGTSHDVTASVVWTSSAPGTASIDAGLVTAHADGPATITATMGALTAHVDLLVTPADLVSILVSPATHAVAKGLTYQLAAMGTYTDGTMADITTMVTWTSSGAGIATVSAGLVHGLDVGAVTIDATANQIHGAASITIDPAIVIAILISPDPLSLAKGLDQPLTAIATYSDTTSADVTATATWTIAAGTAVSITSTGVAHAASQGSGTVRATLDGVSDLLTVTVSAAIPASLSISSGDLTLARQQRAQLRATLTFTDATTQDVTATALWTTSSIATATITAGQIDSQSQSGSATIGASASGFSSSIVATVTASTCHPVINEVLAQGTSGSDEWVEVFNPCTVAVSVAGWTLVYRSSGQVAGNDSNTLQALTGTMAVGELRLFAGLGYTGTTDGTWGGGAGGLLAGTSGAIGLRSGPVTTGPLVDAVAYGAITAGHPFIETSVAPALANGKSIARAPFDGNDTDDNSTNFALTTAPTPRARNF